MYQSKYFPGMYIKLICEWQRLQFSIIFFKDTSITEIAKSITNVLKLILIHSLNLALESGNDDRVAYDAIIVIIS